MFSDIWCLLRADECVSAQKHDCCIFTASRWLRQTQALFLCPASPAASLPLFSLSIPFFLLTEHSLRWLNLNLCFPLPPKLSFSLSLLTLRHLISFIIVCQQTSNHLWQGDEKPHDLYNYERNKKTNMTEEINIPQLTFLFQIRIGSKPSKVAKLSLEQIWTLRYCTFSNWTKSKQQENSKTWRGDASYTKMPWTMSITAFKYHICRKRWSHDNHCF